MCGAERPQTRGESSSVTLLEYAEKHSYMSTARCHSRAVSTPDKHN